MIFAPGFRGRRPVDPFTSLLLHCDGADAATAFPDASSFGHAVTANGNAQVDTAQSVFGGASLLVDGSGDYLSCPSHASLQLGSGDFTLDFRFRTTGGITNWGAIGKIGEWELYNDSNRWVLKINGGSNVFVISWASTDGTWYHVACVRNAGTTTIYVNGTSIGSGTSVDVTDGAGAVRIGGNIQGLYLNGWMDEVRVSKGIARWTANFTPPAAAYS